MLVNSMPIVVVVLITLHLFVLLILDLVWDKGPFLTRDSNPARVGLNPYIL